MLDDKKGEWIDLLIGEFHYSIRTNNKYEFIKHIPNSKDKANNDDDDGSVFH